MCAFPYTYSKILSVDAVKPDDVVGNNIKRGAGGNWDSQGGGGTFVSLNGRASKVQVLIVAGGNVMPHNHPVRMFTLPAVLHKSALASCS